MSVKSISPSIFWRVVFHAALSFFVKWEGGHALVVKTDYHQLQYVIPENHEELTFLNNKRLESTDLMFWNGIGTIEEKVYILARASTFRSHKSSFEINNMTLEMAYSHVKFTYVEDDPEHPNKAPTGTLLEEESSNEDDDSLDSLDSDAVDTTLSSGKDVDDQVEAELLILKRNNRYASGQGDPTESVSTSPRSQGLVPVKPLINPSGRPIPLNTGILYRIQSVQTLIQGKEASTPHNGDWIAAGQDGRSMGFIPVVGEYIGVSFTQKRAGVNPFLTAEEETFNQKNDEYQSANTKAVLWMFVPSEVEKFYEIRSRNFPMSLLVWNYDTDEGEFVLSMETRRKYLRRYQAEGDLRSRALFSVEMISETFTWELRHHRPKFYLVTYNYNHVYLYESGRKGCSILIVRNSGLDPYSPPKTDKIGRPLDMFYITRLNLTGKVTASIFSFLYEKSIVDVFAASEKQKTVTTLAQFDMINRSPLNSTQFVHEEITQDNNYTFHFHDSMAPFGWVTVEAQVPSFGIAPVVKTGILGDHTDSRKITRKMIHSYKIKDKIQLASGQALNCTIIFQYAKNFDNPFSALMEIMEPADRLFWDKNGKPRFIRMSLPGGLIEHNWKKRGHFHFERVIERRETALVVQIKGNMIGSYGLRGFVKKVPLRFSQGMKSCDGF